MDAYLTAPALARIYHCSKSTIHRWAREDSWRRHQGRPCAYSCADAQASYDRRHTGRIQAHLLSRLTQW